MEIFTVGVLLAIAAKLGIGIGGVAGVAKGVNWFSRKSFNSKSKRDGALDDRLKFDSEKS
jgi:hypothetical protein